ncbi:MAG: DUF1013 domain-containing protein [Hyphomicrobiales bacterium]|mgnify:CR=1 FL=1|nr:MAG: DUF1013 domain-containing protein [Hyphomicrobiales bacterium]
MAQTPLMPKATAVWLVDNTSLTFEQIADFCDLHVLEVKGIADGDVAQGIKGMDPVAAGQLARSELERGQGNPAHKLKMAVSKVKIPEIKRKKAPRYTPLSRRQDRPAAIAWLLRHHPELRDSEIIKLVGTTKPTIEAIRERTHWNAANIQPADPVTLGLTRQTELDEVVKKAAVRAEAERRKLEAEAIKSGTLLSPEESLAPEVPDAPVAELLSAEDVMRHKEATETASDMVNLTNEPKMEPLKEKEYDADSVFADLDKLKKPVIEDED